MASLPDFPVDAVWKTPDGKLIEAHMIKGEANCQNCRSYRGLGQDVDERGMRIRLCKWFKAPKGIPPDTWLGVKTCLMWSSKGEHPASATETESTADPVAGRR